jgi:hypothetical protein
VLSRSSDPARYQGTEEDFSAKAAEMDAYAASYAVLADRIWEEKYLGDKEWAARIKTAEEHAQGVNQMELYAGAR